MVDVREQPRPRMGLLAGHAATFFALILVGCSSVSLPEFSNGPRLSATDFRNPQSGDETATQAIPTYIPEQRRAERVDIRSLTEAQADAGVGEIGVEIGEPVLQRESDPGTPGQPQPAAGQGRPAPVDMSGVTMVDAKVGDLNGLPIIARSWLESLGPRLRAESIGKSRAEWRAFAANEINNRLIANLQDELFLAEARAGLTDQERAGLRVFLERFEQDVVRSSYGSQTLADEQLRRTSGIGLEEAKRERERAALVSQIQQRIRDRVQVTSRDLTLEYERSADEFNPPPSAVFRLIRVRSAEQDTITSISEALVSTPFEEVAADERNQTPDPTTRAITGDLASTELFGLEALQEAASQLSPGEWQGPIDAGTFTYWVYLDRIEDTSRTLYEAQLELRQRLMQERGIEETSRYLLRLFERAGISGFDDLIVRLVQIAESWYYQGEQSP